MDRVQVHQAAAITRRCARTMRKGTKPVKPSEVLTRALFVASSEILTEVDGHHPSRHGLPSSALADSAIVDPEPIVCVDVVADVIRDWGARGLNVQPRHRTPRGGAACGARLRRLATRSRCVAIRWARTKGSVCRKRRSRAATGAASAAAQARTRSNGVCGRS